MAVTDPGTQPISSAVARRSRVEAAIAWLELHKDELDRKDRMTLTFHFGPMDVQAELAEKHRLELAPLVN